MSKLAGSRKPLAAKPEKGLTERIVRQISAMKGEPEWMLKSRLKAAEAFKRLPLPFQPEMAALKDIDFDGIYYLPEGTGSAAVSAAEESQEAAVLQRASGDLEKQGVIFLGMDAALKAFPDLVRRHFGAVVSASESKFAALNAAVWSGGSFVYVPKGVAVAFPLEASIRIGAQRGQFERTLIVADEGSQVHYIEGCAAAAGVKDALHASAIEIVALPRARIRFTTLQNWPREVVNLVTERAVAHEGAVVEWFDANLGSRLTLKHPGVTLAGPGARGEIFTCALAGSGQRQDTGGELIFAAPHCSGRIVSKSVAKDGGRTGFHGLARVPAGAQGARVEWRTEALLLDGRSRFEFHPALEIEAPSAALEREDRVSRLDEELLFYLASRGFKEKEAAALVVSGFFEPFTRELPLEYSVEFSRLLQLEMETELEAPNT